MESHKINNKDNPKGYSLYIATTEGLNEVLGAPTSHFPSVSLKSKQIQVVMVNELQTPTP